MIQLSSDGLDLSPEEYSQLLLKLSNNGIEADVYSRGGVVGNLEERMAALLGKEMCVYVPTGTLANHLALRQLARDGQRVIVQRESHVYNDAGDCAQRLSGLNLLPLAAGSATLRLSEIAKEIERTESGRVKAPVAVVSIETPVRSLSGEVMDFAEMEKISVFARQKQIGLHLDGARLFLLPPYTGKSVKAYAALFDTVYVSLYKYFNSSSGAILAGPKKLLNELYHQRRMFGGGMHQVWPDAAIALHFLEGFTERYAKAAKKAETLFQILNEHPQCRIERLKNGSHISRLHVDGPDAATLPARLLQHGIKLGDSRESTTQTAIYNVHTNESLLERPIEDLAGQILAEVR